MNVIVSATLAEQWQLKHLKSQLRRASKATGFLSWILRGRFYGFWNMGYSFQFCVLLMLFPVQRASSCLDGKCPCLLLDISQRVPWIQQAVLIQNPFIRVIFEMTSCTNLNKFCSLAKNCCFLNNVIRLHLWQIF